MPWFPKQKRRAANSFMTLDGGKEGKKPRKKEGLTKRVGKGEKNGVDSQTTADLEGVIICGSRAAKRRKGEGDA